MIFKNSIIYVCFQMRQRVRDTVKHVVGLSTTHHTQATRVLGMRHPLRSYDCYEPVVEEFSRTCFHLPQVSCQLCGWYPYQSPLWMVFLLPSLSDVCLNSNLVCLKKDKNIYN